MKSTLDLPDELVRQVKMRALQSDRKLKDMVERAISRGRDCNAPGSSRHACR